MSQRMGTIYPGAPGATGRQARARSLAEHATSNTTEEANVQTDLLGHDFFVFINATTGLTNVIYHRKNGGYGIIKPRIEENE